MADVPLERAATRLKVVHRQRVTRAGDAEPMPEFVAAALAPDVLGAAAGGWQRLVETEYESIVIAGWMTSALARLGAPLDLVGAFGRVVEDEIRHVDLCAQMVETFGSRPVVPRGDLPPFPAPAVVGAAAANPAEAEFEILAGLVGFFCVFEQLSGFIFRQAIEAADEPRARWALGEIFRDEAFHGAFGFEAAAWFVPRWDDARRARLATRVAADLARFEARLRGPARAPAADPTRAALERLGLLSTDRLLATFYAGVEADLVPRLRQLGIPIEVARGPDGAPGRIVAP
jgi:hypothetical protein